MSIKKNIERSKNFVNMKAGYHLNLKAFVERKIFNIQGERFDKSFDILAF